MITVSAFGVEHTVVKSYVPGLSEDYKKSHKATADTSREQRLTIAQKVGSDRSKRRQSGSTPTPKAKHGLADVYSQYGYFQREAAHRQYRPRDPVEEMKESTTPSAVHRNIHYGDSVSAAHRKELDSHFDRKVTSKLRHPVHIHHDPYTAVSGSAIGAHASTGGKAHIVFGSSTFIGDSARDADTANHELAHASTHGLNPVVAERRKWRYGGGEEGRADALSGTDAYIKDRAVPPPTKGVRRALRVVGSKPGMKVLSHLPVNPKLPSGVEAVASYHRVRAAARAAKGLLP